MCIGCTPSPNDQPVRGPNQANAIQPHLFLSNHLAFPEQDYSSTGDDHGHCELSEEEQSHRWVAFVLLLLDLRFSLGIFGGCGTTPSSLFLQCTQAGYPRGANHGGSAEIASKRDDGDCSVSATQNEGMDLGGGLRLCMIITSLCAGISVVIDHYYFPRSTFTNGVRLIGLSLWTLYFFVSMRVNDVFRTKTCEAEQGSGERSSLQLPGATERCEGQGDED